MTLSRSRRIATGIAAGIVVLCAALIGASLRGDDASVSVASETLSATPIPILDDPVDEVADDDTTTSVDATDPDATDLSDETDPAGDAEAGDPDLSETDLSDPDDTTSADTTSDDPDADNPDSAASAETDPAEDAEADGSDAVRVIEEDAIDEAESEAGDNQSDAEADAASAPDPAPAETGDTDPATPEPATAQPATPEPATPEPATPEPATAQPATPPTASSLGTGGGVSGAECGLDRLVIYAGVRSSGVAGRLRAALTSAGFGAGCSAPVTILASNCPLQFSGVLPAGSGYDPSRSFVASSVAVDRDTMTAVMGSIGYTGNAIDILDFGFVQPDRPGEQWIAVFIPPTLTGWEQLASRAGVGATTQSLCSASGQLVG